MKKKSSNKIIIIFTIIALLIYPIYAFTIWNISKSPDDFSKFPKSGIWVCENKDFTMTIELDEDNDEIVENPINAKLIQISFDGETYNLDCHQVSGHGTIIAPVAPQMQLSFSIAEDLQEESYNKNYIDFSVSKYKFNEDDFYLLDISIGYNNKVEFLKNKMDLHFVRKT